MARTSKRRNNSKQQSIGFKGHQAPAASSNSQALHEQQTADEARVGYIRRELAEHPSRGLTPARLHQILEAAEQGDLRAQHELFLDMEEKDAQISADLDKRILAAAELEWQIVPPENPTPQEQACTDFCIEVFNALEVEDLITDLGKGIGHGWSNLELPWHQQNGKWHIEQPIARPHAWFQLNQLDYNELRLRDNTAEGAQLWPMGWVQHRHKSKSGYVSRSGLHRVLVWPYMFQHYAIGDLAELLDIYGIPARLGRYPRNASDNEKATLLRAVTSLGHSAAGIIPEGMSIEFLTAADGKSDMFEAMLHWCERAKSKAILGGTLASGTGEGTNTNALGNVHERGLQSLVRSDARQYASSIRKYILQPLAMLNFGITDLNRVPTFYLDTSEPEDLLAFSQSVPALVSQGMKIPLWWAHEKTGIPKATDDEEMLQAPAMANPYGFLKAEALKAEPKPLTALAPEQILALARDKAAKHTDQWFTEIEKLIGQVENFDDLQDKLLELYPALTLDEYAQTLSEAQQAARLAGRNDIEEER